LDSLIAHNPSLPASARPALFQARPAGLLPYASKALPPGLNEDDDVSRTALEAVPDSRITGRMHKDTLLSSGQRGSSEWRL